MQYLNQKSLTTIPWSKCSRAIAHSWQWLVSSSLCTLLAGCGPSLQDQCAAVFETIQAAQSQQELGTQTQATTLKNAQIYQTLATDLRALSLKDQTLDEHRQVMATAYEHVANVTKQRAELMDSAGSISYPVGDTAMEQTIDNLQAKESQAYDDLQMVRHAYASYCLYNR